MSLSLQLTGVRSLEGVNKSEPDQRGPGLPVDQEEELQETLSDEKFPTLM